MLNNVWKRLALVAVAWIVFGFTSTIIYMKYIHDVGGTFWFMGIFALPVALLIVRVADHFQNKSGWLNANPNFIAAIDCALAISLWFIPGGAVSLIGMLIASWFW